jgi:hypothetical protein
MFLISKYDNPKILWRIYLLINFGLVAFIISFLNSAKVLLYLIPIILISAGILLFAVYCRKSYLARIRKQVDEEMKISLLSVAMMLLPLVFLVFIIVMLLFLSANAQVVLAYGFTIFFGWLTAIILGMTFKTLPFIVWNKIYHTKAGLGKTPNPKDLFSSRIFKSMAVSFLVGYVCFAIGIVTVNEFTMNAGAIFLLSCAILYNINVFKLFLHREVVS